MPLLISYSLYRFESNVRSPTMPTTVAEMNVTSTGAHWRAIRRRENMANLCQLSFQKKLRSSVFCSSLNSPFKTIVFSFK